jgi:L-ribulose-5-phosphate 4-epimerase
MLSPIPGSVEVLIRREPPPGQAPAMSLARLKTDVAQANIELHRSGLVLLSFGNVSGVDRDAGILAIKPSGVPYDTLTAEDIVVVSLQDGSVVDGRLRPSTDTPTHRHLYLELAEVGGVVHTHSAHATAWAQAGRAIPALGTTHADFFRGPVPVTRPLDDGEIEGEYEEQTGVVIVDTLRAAGRTPTDCPGILVASHGPFTWGDSPAAAVANAIALESIAAMAFETLAIESGAAAVSDILLRRHHDRKHGPAAYYGQPSGERRRH